MHPDYWKKRCWDAEERLRRMCARVINPPIAILHIDYKERAGNYRAKLHQFRHLFGRLYWGPK